MSKTRDLLEKLRKAKAREDGQEEQRRLRGEDWYLEREFVRKEKERGERERLRELWLMSDEFLQSHEWRKLRYETLLRYRAECMACGATRLDGVKLVVDHIIPRRERPDLALDPGNLQVLCVPCNHGKGSWDRTDWRPKA